MEPHLFGNPVVQFNKKAKKRPYDKADYLKNRDRILARQKIWQAANPEKIKAYRAASREKIHTSAKAWRERNPDKVKIYQTNPKRIAYKKIWNLENRANSKAYREVNRIKLRDGRLKRQFGISLEQFEKIFDAQGQKCLICKTSKFTRHGPVVDHCHIAGHVRGILCHRCNIMIGLARNSPEVMVSAAKYLSKELIFNHNMGRYSSRD
jgi:hypothetical protein